MVELDDLRKTWAEYDRKLDVNIRLSRQLLMATNLNRVRSPLRRLAFFLGLESSFGLRDRCGTWLFYLRAHCHGAVCATCRCPGSCSRLRS